MKKPLILLICAVFVILGFSVVSFGLVNSSMDVSVKESSVIDSKIAPKSFKIELIESMTMEGT